MTDNEIIKALKCCVTYKQICPETCPMVGVRQCAVNLRKKALDLINRQKEQIEGLISGQETLQKALAEKSAEVKMLQTYITNHPYRVGVENADIYTENHEEYEKLLVKLSIEAVKEFAERLKSEIINKPSAFKATQATVDFLNGLTHRQHEILNDIDNLVKEMVGEG